MPKTLIERLRERARLDRLVDRPNTAGLFLEAATALEAKDAEIEKLNRRIKAILADNKQREA